jgi:DNA-binding beta-propeller fold protein YncE
MGYADGAGNATQFYGQEGIGVTPDGKTVYVADGNGGDGSPHHRIRAIAMPSSL